MILDSIRGILDKKVKIFDNEHKEILEKNLYFIELA
jgi:hypothetical protein